MARIPSSRHTLHHRLWFLVAERSRFSLYADRSSWIINAPAPRWIPGTRLAFARSGIIHIPLPLCAGCLFVTYSRDSIDVLSVGLRTYDACSTRNLFVS